MIYLWWIELLIVFPQELNYTWYFIDPIATMSGISLIAPNGIATTWIRHSSKTMKEKYFLYYFMKIGLSIVTLMLHGIALTLIDWFNVLELNLTWFFYKNSLDYKRNNSLEILSLGNTLATCNKLINGSICFQIKSFYESTKL